MVDGLYLGRAGLTTTRPFIRYYSLPAIGRSLRGPVRCRMGRRAGSDWARPWSFAPPRFEPTRAFGKWKQPRTVAHILVALRVLKAPSARIWVPPFALTLNEADSTP
jgi:hypothetical protein